MNIDKVEFDDVEENGIYTSSRGQISDHIGARKLGYNLTVLPPGKVQCPFHSHHGEEEMFLVLEGEGELRFGDRRYPIRKHDVIACPTGGPEVAHQMINTGSQTMRYPGAVDAGRARRVRVPGLRSRLWPTGAASRECARSSEPRTPSTTTTASRHDLAGAGGEALKWWRATVKSRSP